MREPPLEERIAYYLPLIASLLANQNKGRGEKKVKPSELDPWFDPWNATAPTETEELRRITAALKSPE